MIETNPKRVLRRIKIIAAFLVILSPALFAAAIPVATGHEAPLSGSPIVASGESSDTTQSAGNHNPDQASPVATATPVNSRSYTKAEITARIPPGLSSDYPGELRYLVPVVLSGAPSQNAVFVVTVHGVKDPDSVSRDLWESDLLSIWKKMGNDRYALVSQDEIGQGDAYYEKPVVFSANVLITGQGADHHERALFLDLLDARFWGGGAGVEDDVRVVDDGGLRSVDIDLEPEQRVLRPGEYTWNSLGNSFSDDKLGFGFGIWQENQCHACGPIIQAEGTYKVIKEMHYNESAKVWLGTWKMVVDTIKRD